MRDTAIGSDEKLALVLSLFEDSLGGAVPLDANFFRCGGNSLAAVKLVAKARAATGCDVPLRVFFADPTPSALHGWLVGSEVADAVAERDTDDLDTGELSAGQRRLWFLNELRGPGAEYNISFALRLRGALDPIALRHAVVDVVERHEPLRTTFPSRHGRPVAEVGPADGPDLWEVIETDSAALRKAINQFAHHPFDLRLDAPFRARLFRIAPDDHVLLFVVHHIAADAWSLLPLSRDLDRAYTARRNGGADPLPALGVTYGDYTRRQARRLGDVADPSSEAARQLAYWREQLRDVPGEVELPCDHPTPPTPTGLGETLSGELDAEAHSALVDLARRHDATPFMVLEAAVACALSRLGAGDDIPIGIPTAGRTSTTYDEIVGFFVNTLVIRNRLDGDPTFTEVLARTREACLGAFAHQDVPFDDVVRVVNPDRVSQRNPIFRVMMVLQNNVAAGWRLDDLDVAQHPLDAQVANFDLSFSFEERWDEHNAPAGLQLGMQTATDRFGHQTAARLLAAVLTVVRQVASSAEVRLSEFAMVSDEDLARLRVLGTGPTLQSSSTRSPYDVFAATARRHPAATCLIEPGTSMSWTYAEVAADSLRVARALIAAGVGVGDVVAIAAGKSRWGVVSLLAVSRIRGVFWTVDTSMPPERLERMAAVAQPRAVLTASESRLGWAGEALHLRVDRLAETDEVTHDEATCPVDVSAGSEPAYVLFTSGSTGEPKGVLVSTAGIGAVTEQQDHVFDLGPEDRVLQLASPSFDVSVEDYLTAFAAAATLVLGPDGLIAGEDLDRLVQGQAITYVEISPSVLASSSPTAFSSVRALNVGGEVCSAYLTAEWAPGRQMVNTYGPTEATVTVTWSRDLMPGELPGIGRPGAGVRLYVLDAHLTPVAPGVPGELYIAGPTLAIGYFGRPDLTASSFVADPVAADGSRMYRTGDRVRWRDDGELEFLGRVDHQVKIRGARVEPAEVEAAVQTQLPVTECAVVPQRLPDGSLTLAAYVVADREPPTDWQAVLRDVLPSYMIPSHLIRITEMPRNAAGKLAVARLPVPVVAETHTTSRAPSTDLEVLLHGLFTEALGIAPAGVDEDFFALGGHSLAAAGLVARARSLHGIELCIRDVFDAPSIAALAHRVRRDRPTSVRPSQIGVGSGGDSAPLSYQQRDLWDAERAGDLGSAQHVSMVFKIEGRRDTNALRCALTDLSMRHGMLRTHFPSAADGPVQRVLDAGAWEPDVEVMQVGTAEIAGVVDAAVAEPFDLGARPPWRARLLEQDGENAVLVVVLHHILTDGWSNSVLLRDLGTAYEARCSGEEPGWCSPDLDYLDYARWQRVVLDGADGIDESDAVTQAHERYWRTALVGLPREHALASDRPRGLLTTGAAGRVEIDLGPERHRRLLAAAREQGVTPFMVLQTALATALSHGGGPEIVLGVPVSGRAEPELHNLVGLCADTVVIRIDTSGNPTGPELVDRVRAANVEALEHQELPFARVIELLDAARSPHRHPIFQVRFSYEVGGTAVDEGAVVAPLRLGELVVRPVEGGQLRTHLDLRIGLIDTGSNIQGVVDFAADLFDAATAQGLCERWLHALDRLCADLAHALNDDAKHQTGSDK